jgi:hypothetical protein
MSRKEEIARLGKELDERWNEIQRITEQALSGRYRIDAVCVEIDEACQVEAELRKAQFLRVAETRGLTDYA